MSIESILPKLTSTCWRIDEPLTNRASDQTMVVCGFCSLDRNPKRNTHFAKWFLAPTQDEIIGERMDAKFEPAWLYFQRQAIVATQLSQLVACQLDGSAPLLVFPRWSGVRLDHWLLGQSQVLSRAMWASIAVGLLQQLLLLHRTGIAHCQLSLEHLWMTEEQHVRLIGLGRCEIVGEVVDGPMFDAGNRQRESIFLPPERRLPLATIDDCEISSAEDIFSAAVVLDKVGHGQFLETPIGRCMTAENPYDRPTAGELVELFASYLGELEGSFSLASERAA